MIITHLYFTFWIIEIWGIKLKTFLFLTKINFFSNFFYFTYTSLIGNIQVRKNNLSDSEKLSEKFSRENFQNTLFKFSFCLSVGVNILFWTITIIDPSMLGNTPTPVVLELFLHGGNLLVLFVDYLLDKNIDKGNHRMGKSFLFKFSLFYILLQYAVYYFLSIEIYPMIGKITVPQFLMMGVAGYGLFYVGHVVYEKVLVYK